MVGRRDCLSLCVQCLCDCCNKSSVRERKLCYSWEQPHWILNIFWMQRFAVGLIVELFFPALLFFLLFFTVFHAIPHLSYTETHKYCCFSPSLLFCLNTSRLRPNPDPIHNHKNEKEFIHPFSFLKISCMLYKRRFPCTPQYAMIFHIFMSLWWNLAQTEKEKHTHMHVCLVMTFHWHDEPNLNLNLSKRKKIFWLF